ncbi:hypothetical protein MBLNU230_g0476t1 [Neophaeotheca triangularis]
MISSTLVTLLAVGSLIADATALPGRNRDATTLPGPGLNVNGALDSPVTGSAQFTVAEDGSAVPGAANHVPSDTILPLRPEFVLEDGSLDRSAFEASKLARRGMAPSQCTFTLQPPDIDLLAGPNALYYQWVMDSMCYYTIASHSSRFSMVRDYRFTHWKIPQAQTALKDRPRNLNPHKWEPNCAEHTCQSQDWALESVKTPPSSCELVVMDGGWVDEAMLEEASVELSQWCWIVLQTAIMPNKTPLRAMNIMPVSPQGPGVASILQAGKRDVATEAPSVGSSAVSNVQTARATHAGDFKAMATAEVTKTAEVSNNIRLHSLSKSTSSPTETASTFEKIKLHDLNKHHSTTASSSHRTGPSHLSLQTTHSTTNQPHSASFTTHTRAASTYNNTTTATPTPSPSPLPWYADSPDSMGSPTFNSLYAHSLLEANDGEGRKSANEKAGGLAERWIWAAVGCVMVLSVILAVVGGWCR